ncbi:hypothetical protein C7271_05485 [filamentous cyanobacterium CCP5]|nr:hypothetical protein C7271_05485 [filamentous cyanobacterium CCP5]
MHTGYRPRAEQQPAKWIERLARFGYAAKGVVYVIVGFLAVQAAFNWGGQVEGSTGAFRAIAAQPLGSVMLFIVALGLIGYSVWRFVEAIRDPEHNDGGVGAFGRRLSYAVSGLIYLGLEIGAMAIVFGRSSSDSGSGSEGASTLMAQPFGQWLVGLVGVAIVAYGFYCFYKGITTKFRQKMKIYEMSPTEANWATRIGRLGLIAKGVVSVITGYFFIQAAKTANPGQARTTEGALQTIQQQPYGAYLMGIVALGLVAYGIHMILQARYRRISP